MNDPRPIALDDAATRTIRLFEAQKQAFAAQPYPTAEQRRAHLRKLRSQLHRYQDVVAEAISRDFGFRAHAESKMLDMLPSTLEINHAIAHLKRWMRPSRRATELLFVTN